MALPSFAWSDAITDMSAVFFGFLLVKFHFGRETEFFRYRFQIVEPLVLFFALIVDRRIHIENFLYIFFFQIFGICVIGSEQLVVEKVHTRSDVGVNREILAGFFASAPDRQDLFRVIGIAVEKREKFGVEFFCPLRRFTVNLINGKKGKHVF